jgi:large subunit ribosomal protein L10
LSLNRSEKEAVISDVTGLAAKAQTLVIAEYRGITVADMTKLRNNARSNGVTLSVLKNTLARRAVAGSAFEVVSDQMTGPLIYGFSVDAVAAAKVVAEFAKTNDKLVIRAGAYGGKALDVNGVKQLASIPSKEVLLAQLLGLMQSPISRTARVLAALAEQRGAGAAQKKLPPQRQLRLKRALSVVTKVKHCGTVLSIAKLCPQLTVGNKNGIR